MGNNLVRLCSWTPGYDTLTSAWFKPSNRWLAFFSVPYHLSTFEVIESFCSSIGKIVSFAKLVVNGGGKTGMRVKIKDCDVKKVPQFIPLVDLGGVVYLIKVSIEDGEVEESDSSGHNGPRVHADTRMGEEEVIR